LNRVSAQGPNHAPYAANLNGKEFARVRIANNQGLPIFTHPGDFGFDGPANLQPTASLLLEGSRCSILFEWHSDVLFIKIDGVWQRSNIGNIVGTGNPPLAQSTPRV
jgi:hypothetical protein